MAKRYERGSMVRTSNLPFTQWASAFADDQTLTDTMLDRLLHRAHIVQINGDSDQLKDKCKAGQTAKLTLPLVVFVTAQTRFVVHVNMPARCR